MSKFCVVDIDETYADRILTFAEVLYQHKKNDYGRSGTWGECIIAAATFLAASV